MSPFSPNHQREAPNGRKRTISILWPGKEKSLSVIFKKRCRKSTSFRAVFVLQNLFGRGVLSTVVNNAIMQMLCSYETALFEGGS